MQESIVAICLTLAFGYIIYTYIQKIRRKGGGCCGCGKDCCTSKAAQCGELGAVEKNGIAPKTPTDGI